MERYSLAASLVAQDSDKMLTLDIKNHIKEHCLEELPNECCGLIATDSDGQYIPIKCRNDSGDPKSFAVINPYDYLKVSNKYNIVGMYHSQENDNPSELDRFTAVEHNIPSIVYGYKNKIFSIISPRFNKYQNNRFEINKHDCLELVRDFYKNELNINLGNYLRDNNWFRNNPSIIFDNFAKEGFYEINYRDREINDILLFGNDKKSISHMGVYIGKDLMLHHEFNRDSEVIYLNHHILKKLVLVVRHQNFKSNDKFS